MKVRIIGMGMGGPGTLTADALEAVRTAEVLVGAERLLAALPEGCSGDRHAAILAEDIKKIADNNLNKDSICVLVSGDAGFYSGAKRLLALLDGFDAEVLPGISSAQYFAARLLRPWQDWRLVSAHGKEPDAAAAVRRNAETFFLTGGALTAPAICARLCRAGLGDIRVTIGENLGLAGEKIESGAASDFATRTSGSLSVLLADNPAPRKTVSCGLPDEAFTRGGAPMTKSEVRSVILSKLRLCSSDIFYDVGAGTGAVSVEAALLLERGQVYAFEAEEEGCRLIRENADKLFAANLTCVEGAAPDTFAGLPAPDAAFVGGSGGRLGGVLDALLRLNPRVRLAVSAVTLETLSEATELFARLPINNTEIVQVSVSRARQLGGYHLMAAQNPVFVLSGEGGA